MSSRKLNTKDMRGAPTPMEIKAAIRKICEDNDYDPFEELILLAKEKQVVELNGMNVTMPLCDVDQRIAIARTIAEYVAPKLKSVEVAGQVDNNLNITVKLIGQDGNGKQIIDLPTKGLGCGEDVQRVLQDQILQPANKAKDELGEIAAEIIEEEKKEEPEEEENEPAPSGKFETYTDDELQVLFGGNNGHSNAK